MRKADDVDRWVSRELSVVIEAVLDDADQKIAPTLGTVKQAMADGFVARPAHRRRG
ncbi:MAG: hypothetical protein M0Z28_18850 [Rhodospirillales bacterium]|nr:hypothetical protein [Rhodospirillales bacterium]